MATRRGSVLATVLFTDIVGSTRVAEEIGDRRWHELISRHHALVRKQLKAYNGRELDTAGDGVFASFGRPEDAIRCACAIVEAVRTLGVEIRAGVHVGQAEAMGSKLGGVTVHAGARVMSAAGPGEVLVSSTTRELVPGSGFRFADRGVKELKGVPGEWRLYAVTGVDGRDVTPPASPEDSAEARASIAPRPSRRRIGGWGAAAIALVVLGVAATVFLANGGSKNPPGPAPRIRVNSVAELDPGTGRVIDDVDVGSNPGAIVVSGDSVWVVNEGDETISRLVLRSGRVDDVDPIGNVSTPCGLAPDPSGGVWVSTCERRQLLHVDADTDRVDRRIRFASYVGQPVVVRGDLWVWLHPSSSRADLIARVDPKTGDILDTIRGIPVTYGMASAFGALWVTGFDQGTLVRIDPSSGSTQVFRNVAAAPVDVAEGPGGLWVTDHGATQVILFDPQQGRIIRTVSAVEGHLVPVSSGVWVLDPVKHELAFVRPDGSRTHVIELPFGDGLAIGDGHLWLSAGTTSLGFIAPP